MGYKARCAVRGALLRPPGCAYSIPALTNNKNIIHRICDGCEREQVVWRLTLQVARRFGELSPAEGAMKVSEALKGCCGIPLALVLRFVYDWTEFGIHLFTRPFSLIRSPSHALRRRVCCVCVALSLSLSIVVDSFSPLRLSTTLLI